MRAFLPALLWHLCLCIIVSAQEADDDAPLKARATDEEIRAIIDKLVSANPPPTKIKGTPGLKYPKEFDRSKQRIVHKAISDLFKLGPISFPELIKRQDDQRFSITMSVGINGYMFNASVGQVCQDIVFDQIQPFGIWPKSNGDPRGKPKRPGYPSTFLGNAKDALEWCDQHKHKTLYEIQLMAVDWVIEEESKKTQDYTDEERAEMKRIRDQLVETKKPMSGSYLKNEIES